MKQNPIPAIWHPLGRKDEKDIKRRLHPSVTFLSHVAEFNGKQEVFGWVKGFLPNFESLTIRSACAHESQAMLAYDIKFPGSDKVVRGAALLDFDGDLISRIELFFDRQST